MERAFDFIHWDSTQIEGIFREVFGKGSLETFRPLSHGAVNTTYKVTWNKLNYVLRFYVRDPKLAQIEKALYDLVHKKVLVAQLISSSSIKGFSFAIFEFVDKPHLFEISDRTLAPALSYDLGKTLSKIHSFHFSQAGLFGSDLKMDPLFKEGSHPYFDYIMEHLTESSPAWKRLGNERAKSLKQFVQTHKDFFPKIQKGGVLVHSDFKPVNLLWEKTQGLTVLDWEFAHSGDPLIDFAVLVRHFQSFPFSVADLEKGYAENGGTLPTDWIRKARATDIINLVQLLDSPADQPRLFHSLLQSADFTLSHWPSLEEKMRKGSI